MSKIRLLPDAVASQVAAGEVVERPASVMKELVENSLDAGSTKIEVHFAGNGARSMRVIDDGSGMDREDAMLCLERHATSKIRSGADLAAIRTLGFRGEAIPSIASVGKFRLRTREAHAVEGVEILVNGGRLETVRACGCPVGTEIEVRSLFFNLPARRKFLRSETTETGHIEHQFLLHALGHPGVAFTLVRDGATVRQLPAATDLLVRVRDIAGSTLATQLAPLQHEQNGLHITGYVGKAGVSRATRQSQLIFVNGRPIDNSIVSRALREGYHTALMKGQFPVSYLFIDMDPAEVDVNVHPAKREVRFRLPRDVQEAVVAAVRAALEQGREAWSAQFQPAHIPQPAVDQAPLPPAPTHSAPAQHELLPAAEAVQLRKDWWQAPTATSHAIPPSPPLSTSLPISQPPIDLSPDPAPIPAAGAFQIIGILGQLYVLMENANGLVIVDQHAAHERILFEEFRRRISAQDTMTQRLLLPVTVDLSAPDAAWLSNHLDDLNRLGVGLEPFGSTTFKIDSLPPFVKADDPARFLTGVITDLQAAARQANRARLGEEVIAKTVCRHAVKAHDKLRGPEVVKLIEDLLACELPYCCPHGRPTMVPLAYDEIEKRFGRRVQ